MIALVAALLVAQPSIGGLPESLDGVGVEQRIGVELPADAKLTDHLGREVALGELYSGRPMILTLVYYECPMLCTLVLNGLLRSMNVLELNVGRDFDVVTISIDPKETPELAKKKRDLYLHKYRRPEAEKGWHFLVGDEAEIRRIADAVGFSYAWDERTQQFAHASSIFVLTPDGRTAQYFFGVDYDPTALRLALVNASKGDVGTVIDAVMLYCFQYDPSTGKYSLAIMQVLRLGAVLTLAVLVIVIGMYLVRERRVPS